MGKLLGFASEAMRFVPILGAAISSVEALLGGGNGDQKKQAALSLAADVTLVTNTLDPNLLSDPDVQDATSKLVDTVVAWQNVVNKAKATQAAAVAAGKK